jgi:glycosyltransferase involved in cell wall biosynthesis
MTRPRKIAYLLTPIEFGGAERVSLNFLQHVDRESFEIDPLLLTRPWEEENLFVRALRAARYPLQKIPVAVRPPNEGRDFFRVVRSFARVRGLLKSRPFDLLHTHGYFADIIGIPAARSLGIPVLSTCHGFIENDSNLWIYNRLDRLLLRFANRIIAVSERIRDLLIRSGIDTARISMLSSGVETALSTERILSERERRRAALGFTNSDWVLGYVGRLSVEKGLVHLIRGGRLLRDRGVPIRIVIVGDGPQLTELQNIARQEGLARNTVFAGFQEDARDWYYAFDVFALPSLTEGTPMALLEAMARGIPSVASAVGGIPQVIQSGENGLLTQPENPEGLADAAEFLYRNRSLWSQVSERARQTVTERYNISAWTRRVESLYREVLEGVADHR